MVLSDANLRTLNTRGTLDILVLHANWMDSLVPTGRDTAASHRRKNLVNGGEKSRNHDERKDGVSSFRLLDINSQPAWVRQHR